MIPADIGGLSRSPPGDSLGIQETEGKTAGGN